MASGSTELELSTAIRALVEEEVREIRDALLRVDEGEYGVCISCDLPVPDARLRVKPQAPRCVPCQVKEDSRSAHSYRPWDSEDDE